MERLFGISSPEIDSGDQRRQGHSIELVTPDAHIELFCSDRFAIHAKNCIDFVSQLIKGSKMALPCATSLRGGQNVHRMSKRIAREAGWKGSRLYLVFEPSECIKADNLSHWLQAVDALRFLFENQLLHNSVSPRSIRLSQGGVHLAQFSRLCSFSVPDEFIFDLAHDMFAAPVFSAAAAFFGLRRDLFEALDNLIHQVRGFGHVKLSFFLTVHCQVLRPLVDKLAFAPDLAALLSSHVDGMRSDAWKLFDRLTELRDDMAESPDSFREFLETEEFAFADLYSLGATLAASLLAADLPPETPLSQLVHCAVGLLSVSAHRRLQHQDVCGAWGAFCPP